MYTKCIIPGCNSTRENAKLHKFPNCVKRLRKWLDCLNSNFLRTKKPCELLKLQVCHLHFEARFKTEKLRLSSSAYPSLFLSSEILSGVPRKIFDTPDILPSDHNAYTKVKHNDHNYYQEEDITRTLQPTNKELSTELETDVGTDETFVDFEEQVLQVHPELSVGYKITGTSIIENVNPTAKAEATQPLKIAKSEVSGTQHQSSAQEEKPSTEPATSVNTTENSIIFVKHILRPCPKPSFLNKVTGTANIKNTNPAVTGNSTTQLNELVPNSVDTRTKHQSSAQGVFSSLLPEDRKKRRAWMKYKSAQKIREKAKRKEMMMYKKKEKCLKSLPQDVQTFINIQMNKASKGHGRRYKAEEMELAHKIFTECRETYWYMWQMFLLPSKTSVLRYAKSKRLNNTV